MTQQTTQTEQTPLQQRNAQKIAEAKALIDAGQNDEASAILFRLNPSTPEHSAQVWQLIKQAHGA